MMRYQTLLFDLDGTLTDPKVGITKSIQHALKKYGIVEEDLDRLEPFIGPPLADSFMEFYGFNEKKAYEAVEYYREYFSERGMYENELYDGIKELLDRLIEKKCRIMLATSKPTFFAEKILAYFEIDHYFEYVCGSHLDGRRTDKAEIIQHIFDVKKIDTEKTVMIGDRKFDIIGAQKNGIDSIAVGYGYGTAEELQAAGPTYFVHSVQQLKELLLGES